MKKILNKKMLILISVLLLLPLLVGCFNAPPTNQSPTITSTPITTATVGVAYTYNVNATDPDGDVLAYSLTTNPAGMTINSTTGLINWTPAAAGDYEVTARVGDGSLFATQTFTIHVSEEAVPTNQAPTITSTPDTTATVNQTYAYNVNATDPDGDTLVYSLTTSPAGMTINSTTGLINWTPTSTGDYEVTARVGDGSLFATQTFTIHVREESETTNQAPNITSTPDTTATVNQTYAYNVNATDPDGDTLAYSLTTNPTGMTINSTTGLINWTPASAQIGNNNVTVKVSDGSLFDTQNFTITVRDEEVTPRLKLTPSSQTVSQGSQVTIDVIVENVTDLKGARVVLNYDASKLQYSSSTAGGFIPNTTLMENAVNGTVTLDIAGLGAASFASGTGTIITVVFDTIGTGSTNITFGTTTLRDKNNDNISHTKSSGCSVNIN